MASVKYDFKATAAGVASAMTVLGEQAARAGGAPVLVAGPAEVDCGAIIRDVMARDPADATRRALEAIADQYGRHVPATPPPAAGQVWRFANGTTRILVAHTALAYWQARGDGNDHCQVSNSWFTDGTLTFVREAPRTPQPEAKPPALPPFPLTFAPLPFGTAHAPHARLANAARAFAGLASAMVAPGAHRVLNRHAVAALVASPPRHALDGFGRRRGAQWEAYLVDLAGLLEHATVSGVLLSERWAS